MKRVDWFVFADFHQRQSMRDPQYQEGNQLSCVLFKKKKTNQSVN